MNSNHDLGLGEMSAIQINSPLIGTSSTLTPPTTIRGRFLSDLKTKFKGQEIPLTTEASDGIKLSGQKKGSSKILLTKQFTLSPTLIKKKREDMEDLLRSGGDIDDVPDPEVWEPKKSSPLKNKYFPATSDFEKMGTEKYAQADFESSHCSIEEIELDPRNCESSYYSRKSRETFRNEDPDEEKDCIDTIIDVNMIAESIQIPSFNEFVREKEEKMQRRSETLKRSSLYNSCFLGLPFAERVNSYQEGKSKAEISSRPRISSFDVR